ncbi:MAG: nuclear transport factor 2 family protein [Vicinamibacterales bacterium]
MKILMAGVLLVASASASFGQSKGTDEIVAAEKSWTDAYQACDLPAMGRILSDDLTLIQHTNGGTMTKEAFVKSVGACAMEKVINDPSRVRVYGDTATVQGTSTYHIKNSATPISVIFTRVWVKNGGQWQVVNHQSTGLPARK